MFVRRHNRQFFPTTMPSFSTTFSLLKDVLLFGLLVAFLFSSPQSTISPAWKAASEFVNVAVEWVGEAYCRPCGIAWDAYIVGPGRCSDGWVGPACNVPTSGVGRRDA